MRAGVSHPLRAGPAWLVMLHIIRVAPRAPTLFTCAPASALRACAQHAGQALRVRGHTPCASGTSLFLRAIPARIVALRRSAQHCGLARIDSVVSPFVGAAVAGAGLPTRLPNLERCAVRRQAESPPLLPAPCRRRPRARPVCLLLLLLPSPFSPPLARCSGLGASSLSPPASAAANSAAAMSLSLATSRHGVSL